jgi:hypothetical protein
MKSENKYQLKKLFKVNKNKNKNKILRIKFNWEKMKKYEIIKKSNHKN